MRERTRAFAIALAYSQRNATWPWDGIRVEAAALSAIGWRLLMILGLLSVFALVAVLCVGIYTVAIYALPILSGLAVYSICQHLGAPTLLTLAVSVIGGALTLAVSRAGLAAQNGSLRLLALAAVALPSAYAGYNATTQLTALTGLAVEGRVVLAAFAGLTVAVLAIERMSRGMISPNAQLLGRT